MEGKSLLLLCLIFISLASFASASLVIDPAPVEVSQENWRKILEGEWMVEFMAPWCPACTAFKSSWDEFAIKAVDMKISLGTIDVTENPGLSGRFLLTGLPTIYHVKDGVFRQYTLGRKVSDLTNFIKDGTWENVPPVSWYTAPDSFQMGLVDLFFRVAMWFRNFYTLITELYGIPEWLCYIIFAVVTIIVGLILGLLIVCCCDMMPRIIPGYNSLSYDASEEDYRDDDLIDDLQDYKIEPLEKLNDKDEDEEETKDDDLIDDMQDDKTEPFEELNDKDDDEEETKVRRRQVEKESSDNK